MLAALTIKNFRTLEDLHVPKLGRVNLIVGKNNVGKSSVLEALRILAGNGNEFALANIASGRDEKYALKESDFVEFNASFPFEDFFPGRSFPAKDGQAIEIGDPAGDLLKIEHGYYVQEVVASTSQAGDIIQSQRLRRIFKRDLVNQNGRRALQALFLQRGNWTDVLKFDLTSARQGHLSGLYAPEYTCSCSLVPTHLVSIDELAGEWDNIAFTSHQAVVYEAMRLILPAFEAITFVRNDDASRVDIQSGKPLRRVAKVKLANMDRLVPLKSLGEGMQRIFQMVLKVFPANGGFLLIDEFESGLHYTVQEKVWAMMFELAHKLDIQVFATTHSWDCIEKFASVAKQRADSDGVLLHLGISVRTSDHGKVVATVFDENELFELTQADMEVR